MPSRTAALVALERLWYAWPLFCLGAIQHGSQRGAGSDVPNRAQPRGPGGQGWRMKDADAAFVDKVFMQLVLSEVPKCLKHELQCVCECDSPPPPAVPGQALSLIPAAFGQPAASG